MPRARISEWHLPFYRTNSSKSGIAYYTDDGSSNSSSVLSSRVPSARSLSVSQQHNTFDDYLDRETNHENQDGSLQPDHDGEQRRHAALHSPLACHDVPVVKVSNLLPIRSTLGTVQSRARSTSPVNLRHPPGQGQMKTNQRLVGKMFRRLAPPNACSLSDADLDKLLFDAALGDGMLSARRNHEGNVKRANAPAINLTIRLASDHETLKKLGCSEGALAALHAIDPPKQEVDIVAEKVETGDMTLLCAHPEAKLQPLAARHFVQKRRQGSPHSMPHDHTSAPTSADAAAASAGSSLLRQQAAHRADGGSPLPSIQDWGVQVKRSPLKFPAMSSTVPRFQDSPSTALADRPSGLTDWTKGLPGSNYTYRSIFTGPARMAEAKQDTVHPPPLQAANQPLPHDRRSCTAQHKHEREPNSLLEARISVALAKEAHAPTTTERMGLKSVLERAAALEVDHIGSHYGPSDHERIRSKQDRLMEVGVNLRGLLCNHSGFILLCRLWHRERIGMR